MRLPAPAAWGAVILLLAGLQLGAICTLLPEYHRRVSLRGQIRRYAEWCESERLPVLCYPRLWDSVSFYLQHDRVETYAPAELPKMMARLQDGPPTLLFIKSDKALLQFKAALPASLEFVPCGRQGKQLHIGLVYPGRLVN